jgi:hypothetical protein
MTLEPPRDPLFVSIGYAVSKTSQSAVFIGRHQHEAIPLMACYDHWLSHRCIAVCADVVLELCR